MKKLTLLFVPVIAILMVGVLWVTRPATADGAQGQFRNASVVGAWHVDAIGAPYVPHLFTYNDDGTMNTTNPTNVQENPSEPDGGTNDSLGMGPWEPVKGEKNTFIGTFYQLNAHVNDHKPADTLSVTYKIKVDGDTFYGKALPKLGPLVAPLAELKGTRLQIDRPALDEL